MGVRLFKLTQGDEDVRGGEQFIDRFGRLWGSGEKRHRDDCNGVLATFTDTGTPLAESEQIPADPIRNLPM